jgi:hypothetical protein
MTAVTGQRLRLRYRKDEVLMWVGHLDVMRLVIKLLRRAEVPFATHGKFSPKPRITYGPPLSLGVSADAELLDIELRDDLEWVADDITQARDRLEQAALPRDFVAGLALLEAVAAPISRAAVAGRYTVSLTTGTAEALKLIEAGELAVPNRDGKPVPVARGILSLMAEGDVLHIDGAVGGAEVFNVMRLVSGLEAAGYAVPQRLRCGLLDKDGKML